MLQSSTSADEAGAPELWYGLRSTFLSGLDDDLKLRIFDLTTRSARELHRWAARYPLMRRVRVWPVCLSVAASAPSASFSALVTMARVGLWLFTIDDLFDEEMVPAAELQRRVTRYQQVLAGERAVPHHERDTLVLALQDIRDELRAYPLFELLQEEWTFAVSQLLDAMMQENEWRTMSQIQADTFELPSYAAYLNVTLFSAGVPFHVWTALITLGDASVLKHLPFLKTMEHSAAICVRLANDLRSYTKELDEGKMNAIVIRQREALVGGHVEAAALQRAYELVQHDLVSQLVQCDQLRDQVRTETGMPERMIADTAHFVCDFYVHYDYHTFSAGTGKR